MMVGGGPVGLSLAIELGLRGVRCLLVEQGDGTIYTPRANTVNSRTMEFCRRWGIADEVRNSGTPPGYPSDVVYLTSLQGYEIARITRPTYGGAKPLATTPEQSQRCNQLWFDPILRKLAASFPNVILRYRCRFESFEQNGNRVTAIVRNLDNDHVERIDTEYLVACCGGQSSVPKTLGVRMEGTRGLSYNLNIFLKIEDFWKYHDKGKAGFYQLSDRDAFNAILIELDGKQLWNLTVNLGTERVSPDAVDVRALIDRLLGPGIPYELVSVLPWTCHSIVATSFGTGRVQLAGDAGHQHAPTGGFGMNVGVGDSTNLGWKLAAVLQGWGGEKLIPSYENERRPVAQRFVSEATDNLNYRFDPAPCGSPETIPKRERQRAPRCATTSSTARPSTSSPTGWSLAIATILPPSSCPTAARPRRTSSLTMYQPAGPGRVHRTAC